MKLFGHPFSSYTWKAVIALYEKALPFEFRTVEDPENGAELARHSAMGKFPLLLDGEQAVFEATSIIEYLDAWFPDTPRLVPADAKAAVRVRQMDRVFDNYVMGNMQAIVADALRPEQHRDPYGVEKARAGLDKIYAWLESAVGGPGGGALAPPGTSEVGGPGGGALAPPGTSEVGGPGGGAFTLADCAAAPSLFYADWAHPIGAQYPRLKAYRARLLARPSVARCVEDARPFRHYFPLGAPDRD